VPTTAAATRSPACFLGNFIRLPLTIGECTLAMQQAGTCGLIPSSVFGAYAVRLSN
jgi:hypothetical protein